MLRRGFWPVIGVLVLSCASTTGVSAPPETTLPSSPAAVTAAPSVVPGTASPAAPTIPATPAQTSTPTPPATSSPTRTPRPTTVPSAFAGGWQRTLDLHGATLGDVIAAPNGLVAVGCHARAYGDCLSGMIVTSPDGRAWTEVKLDRPGTGIWRLQAAGGRLWALGYEINHDKGTFQAVVWSSLDGRTWSTVAVPGSLGHAVGDIVDGPNGALLATGAMAPYASEYGGFVVWRIGSDGRWTSPVRIDTAGLGAEMFSVTWAGTRYIGWGLGGNEGSAERSSVLITSPDGVSWQAVTTPPTLAGGAIWDMTRVGATLVAVGATGRREGPAEPRAWTSKDGTTWAAAAVPAMSGAMEEVVVEPGRLVAVGFTDLGETFVRVAWFSSDGRTWAQAPSGEIVPRFEGVSSSAPAAVGSRSCVVAYVAEETESRGMAFCR